MAVLNYFNITYLNILFSVLFGLIAALYLSRILDYGSGHCGKNKKKIFLYYTLSSALFILSLVFCIFMTALWWDYNESNFFLYVYGWVLSFLSPLFFYMVVYSGMSYITKKKKPSDAHFIGICSYFILLLIFITILINKYMCK